MEIIPCPLFRISRFPQTTEIKFAAHFKNLDEKSRLHLETTSSTREHFVSALNRCDAVQIIQTAEAYFPHLFGFAISIETNANLKTTSPFVYTWSSAIDNKTHNYTCNTHRFELVMSLVSYAYAHLNRASELEEQTSNSVFPEKSREIITYLKKAFAILTNIKTYEFPFWKSLPSEKPLETSESFISEMIKYCVAMVQNVIVKKIQLEQKPQTPSYLFGVSNSYKSMYHFLKEDKFFAVRGDPEYLRLIESQMAMAGARIFRSLALAEYSIDKCGNACAYIGVARKLMELEEALTWKRFLQIGVLVKKYKVFICQVHEKYTNENEKVYHDSIPDVASLPMPQPKYIPENSQWAPPEPGYLSILSRE
jgi:hypothetical protein